jgi:ADP-heptose:LPS heptosyltransferase
MHLADSAGIPCITLFSHRDYYKAWFPEGDCHINLIHTQSCGECHLQECKYGTPAKCIMEITIGEVENAVNSILKSSHQ